MNAVLEILRNSIMLGGGDSNGHENGAAKDISCFDVEDQVLHDRVEVTTDSSDESDSSHHGIEELKPRKMAVALPLPCIESAGVDSSSNPSKPRKMARAMPLPCIESAGVYITLDPPKPRKMAVALPIPCIESAGVDGRPVPLKPKKMAVALPLPCMESAGVGSPPHPRPKKKTNVKNKTVGKKGYDGTETYQSPYEKSAIKERTEIGELSNRGRTNKASKFKTRELEQQQPAYQQCWHHLVSKTRSTLLGVAVLVIIASIVGATVSKNENGAPSSIDNNEMRSNQPTAEPSSNSSLDKKGYLLSILADYGRLRTDTMSWLIENDTWAPPVSSPNEQQLWVERYAIGSFYFLSNPTKSPWRNQDKWLSSETVCLWYGVQCNTVGEVVEINMRKTPCRVPVVPLHGVSPHPFCLKTAYNDIVGYIPTQIGALTSLAKIQLDSNHFSENIPSEIGALSNLLHIDLYFNQLSASLPDEIGALTSLTGLYLRGNRLTGSLPASIGDLTSLTELQLCKVCLIATNPKNPIISYPVQFPIFPTASIRKTIRMGHDARWPPTDFMTPTMEKIEDVMLPIK
eukprot:scaffold332_cov117-Cylindrotheca_fusiformis.AAC.12